MRISEEKIEYIILFAIEVPLTLIFVILMTALVVLISCRVPEPQEITTSIELIPFYPTIKWLLFGWILSGSLLALTYNLNWIYIAKKLGFKIDYRF